MGFGFSPTRAPDCDYSLFLSIPGRALAQPPFLLFLSSRVSGFPTDRPAITWQTDQPPNLIANLVSLFTLSSVTHLIQFCLSFELGRSVVWAGG